MADTWTKEVREAMAHERSPTARTPLVERFGLLFAVLTTAVAVALLFRVLAVPPGGRAQALVAALGLGLWAGAMRHRGDRWVPVDVAALGPMVLAAVAGVEATHVLAALLVTTFQRGFHAGSRRAYTLMVVSLVVWEALRAAGDATADFSTTLGLAVVLAVATSFARTVRRTAEASDRAARRERRMLVAVRSFATHRDSTAMMREVARTAVDLVEIPETVAVVWQARDNHWHAVADFNTDRAERDRAIPAGVLPGQVRRIVQGGQPALLDGEVARQLQHVGEDQPFFPAYVMVPLLREDRPPATMLLYCPAVPDDDLLEQLGRFAAEVALAEERLELLTELAAREARLANIVNHSSDVIALLDGAGRVTMVNPSGEQRFGHRREDVLGRDVLDLVHPEDRGMVADALVDIEDRGTAQVACRFVTADGEWRDIESKLTPNGSGGFVLNARDVTERKQLEAEILHRAYHDPLTDLANRALFMDRLRAGIGRGTADGPPVAVLMLDLDDFKPVNDTYGHQVGDAYLVEVAERLRGAAREQDTVARLGGDEFAVLVDQVGSSTDLAAVATRLWDRLCVPVTLGGAQIPVRASIGATSARLGESHDDLLRRADAALYAVKRAGKGRVRVVGPEESSPPVGLPVSGDASRD